MAKVSAVSAQTARDGETGQLRPIVRRPDSRVTAFTGPSILSSHPGKERRRGSQWECVFQEKGEEGEVNKTKQVVGVTYRVRLFFPSFRASPEALWKHTDRAVSPPKSALQGRVEKKRAALAV